MAQSSGGTVISNINRKGFELIHRAAIEKFSWKEFKSISFDKTKHKVVCKRGMFQKVILPDYFEGWYCFIRKIPNQFKDFDRQYVDTFFAGLKACKICGNYAVHNETCCNCGNEAWNSLLAEEYDHEHEYIKQEQLDFFATLDETEPFKGFYRHNACFRYNPNWLPLVNYKELVEYCEEHYWE